MCENKVIFKWILDWLLLKGSILRHWRKKPHQTVAKVCVAGQLQKIKETMLTAGRFYSQNAL